MVVKPSRVNLLKTLEKPMESAAKLAKSNYYLKFYSGTLEIGDHVLVKKTGF